jgi:hypothetical protein
MLLAALMLLKPSKSMFLAGIAVWNLATGAFNPFFNAFFARHLTLRLTGSD